MQRQILTHLTTTLGHLLVTYFRVSNLSAQILIDKISMFQYFTEM